MRYQNKEDFEMSGNRYFLANAVITLLRGNSKLETLLSNASWIGTSSIVLIEFLSFDSLGKEDLQTLESFISRIHVEGLSADLPSLVSIANLRLQHKFKLPDAIIVAQSLFHNAQLISNDRQLQSFTNFNF